MQAERRRRSFRAFVSTVHPRFRWYRHCEILTDVLQQVGDGAIKRLLVFMPPRHGKSELVSRLFPAWWLSRRPEQWVGLCSYGAELAFTLSRSARDFHVAGGGPTRDDVTSVKHWETGRGGGMWAAGVGGPITGKGWHLGVIDDPVKNAEDAASDKLREQQREWYRSTFSTREEPGGERDPDGALVVVQTRWHDQDLAGWLLEQESGDEPERWHVLDLPAIAEAIGDRPVYPPTCVVHPDWRAPGEPLCPERRPLAKLRAIEERIGPYHWAALFQQRPRPRGGNFFERDWFEIVEASPAGEGVERVRAWDRAATPGGGDWTVGARLACSGGVYWVEDIVRARLGPGDRDRLIRQTAELDGRACRIVGEQEPGSAGVDQAAAFVRLLAGFRVTVKPATGSKIVRADPLASQARAGNVRLIRGDWNRAWLDEMTAFPTGKHDDQVDASDLAFAELAGGYYTAGAF